MPTRIQLCGRIVIELEGLRLEAGLHGRQGRLLFAYLVARRRHAVTHDELAGAIWPEEPPAAAAGNLRVLLSRLRRLLGPEVLSTGRVVELRLPDGSWVDLEVADEKVHEAEAALHRGDWSRAMAAAVIAMHVAERPFLPGEDAPWVQERRRRLADVHVRAVECDGVASLGIGGSELAGAEREARRVVELAPFRESGHRLLMEVLARQGNVAEALLAYERLRVLLGEELGAVPGAATQALHRRLLQEGA